MPSWDDLPSPHADVKPWLFLYTAISLTGAFLTLLYIALGYVASIHASRKLFFAMLHKLIRAPVRFFDVSLRISKYFVRADLRIELDHSTRTNIK